MLLVHIPYAPHTRLRFLRPTALLLIPTLLCIAVLTPRRHRLAVTVPATAPPEPIAHTACGTVRGVWISPGVAAFRGIRYGRAERWQPPQPACADGDVVDATAVGPACPQLFPIGQEQREDCLHLDVFTPNLPIGTADATADDTADATTDATADTNAERRSHGLYSTDDDDGGGDDDADETVGTTDSSGGSGVGAGRLLPVLVNIPGGSFVAGSSRFSPVEAFALNGGRVVVVSINYRLGLLGFAALPALAAADPRRVSGNYGLLDQQLALGWVRDHARAFGGDSARVTLIGQSTGGSSILLQLGSPGAAGLFHAAIALSASPRQAITPGRKHAQDRRHWLANGPCADADANTHTDADADDYADADADADADANANANANADADADAVLACLRNASVAQLLEAADPRYSKWDLVLPYSAADTDTDTLTPAADADADADAAADAADADADAGGGIDWLALPYVDGVTVRSAVLTDGAMHDVPLVLEWSQAEFDLIPAPTLHALTAAAAPAFVRERLAPLLPPSALEPLVRAYAPFAALAPEYMPLAMDADAGIGCGNIAVAEAVAATAGRASPVYLALNARRPSAPVHQVACELPPSSLPCHMSDFLAALGVWGVPACALTPTAADRQFGAMLAGQWIRFAESGGRSPPADGWPPLHAAGSGAGGGYRMAVFDGDGVEVVPNHKQEVCRLWRDAGIGQAYWWIN